MESRTIVGMTANNVMRLKAVSISPDDNFVVIGGENAQGKSSVLNAISMALGGKKLCPSDPIRHGEDEAEVTVDLGDLRIRRVFKRKGEDFKSFLEVYGAEGEKIASPQKLLDRMTGSLTFDPLHFANASPKEQLEMLKKVTGLEDEFDMLDEARQKLYEDRRVVGRHRDEVKGQLKALSYDEDAGEEEVSLEELLRKLREAREHNEQGMSISRTVSSWKEKIQSLQMQIDHLMTEKAAAEVQLEAAEQRYMSFEFEDLDEIESQVEDVEEINKVVRRNIQFAEKSEEFRSLSAQYTELSAEIEQIDLDKELKMEKAELPIDGLMFDWDRITFNGTPLDQCSSAERLKVSVAVGIAENKELRVMFIREGSVLDQQNLRLLMELADEHGAQLWVERVGEGAEVAIVIEDGQVVDRW